MSPSRNIEEFERCWPWLEKAVEYEVGGAAFGKSDVWQSIHLGHYQFWPRLSSATVTQIVETPRRKYLHVLWVGGSGRDLIDDFLPTLERWGLQQGCREMVGVGRIGWGRRLQKQGFNEVARVYAKQLAKD